MTWKTFRNILLYGLAAMAAAVLLFIGYARLTEYHPPVREILYQNADTAPLPDTLTILSWNIGYGGLGAGMDFFYDGGQRTRESRAQTSDNLTHIIEVLQQADADVILLQEVDRRSRRSYRIDEVARLQQAFPDYTLVYALNYKTDWIPIPLRAPLGGVDAGLVVLSRVAPLDAVRWSYPSHTSFPQRLFDLKRCLLTARFVTFRGDTLLIANTHNSAYDKGEGRTGETAFLQKLLSESEATGTITITGGDWNQYPAGYMPSAAVLSDPHYRPQAIDEGPFAPFARFVYDPQVPTLRYLDRPYSPESKTTLTDFFLVSTRLEVLSVQTLREDFRASDHNPVLLRVSLRKE